MILNKDSLIQLLTQNGCEYDPCPPSLTYKDYRFLTFNHWFYDTDTDFRLHTQLTNNIISCEYSMLSSYNPQLNYNYTFNFQPNNI